MKSFRFEVIKVDKKTKARLGVIHTPYGDIQTPSFVPVGTQATVKSLTPDELDTLGVQLYFVNTYHMYLRPGIEVVKKFGGLHNFMRWDKPLMTDSGGFQVFSLGRSFLSFPRPPAGEAGRRESKAQDSLGPRVKPQDDNGGRLVKISDDGVEFRSHWDGSKHLFTPESSMGWQWDLGADIHIAFDDCTPYPVTHEKASISLDRTHQWAVRSLEAHRRLSLRSAIGRRNNLSNRKIATPSERSRNDKYQALYGSVQGSVYEDLRKKSAEFIGGMDFDGFAIGGVSVGESKKEMVDAIHWTVPLLPDDKPRHLLGVGEIDDIFALVEAGIDTFDCVQPTRLARVGMLFTKKHELDITKSAFAGDTKPIDDMCRCYTCLNFSRAYLHHLFHVRELLAYRLATIHNIFFVQSLVSDIRRSIGDGSFLELKKKWL